MSRPAPQRTWGIRTLLFLGLAAAFIILSNWMRMTATPTSSSSPSSACSWA
jgi:hypothetical protein